MVENEMLSKKEVWDMAVRLAASLIEAHQTPVEELSSILGSCVQVVETLNKGVLSVKGRLPVSPAVPISESVHNDYIVCLEDGKKLQMLKRHLSTVYKMTLDEYKERWGLPADYPVVAPNYAARRSSIAKSSGLGRSGRRKMRVVEGRSGSAVVA